MKSTVVIAAAELQQAALAVLLGKSQFRGKHVATTEFVFDPGEANPERRIRAEVILFDTAAAAARYASGEKDAEDEPRPGAQPEGPQPESLEGEPHGRKQ